MFSCSLIGSGMQMTFSPTGATLALADAGKVFFIDVIGRTFSGWTRGYDDFDILALQYSPDGRFLAAAGKDLKSDYNIRFDGFIYMFNERGDDLWNLASGGAGERLPGIDTLAFSACSTKVACVASGNAEKLSYKSSRTMGYTWTMARMGLFRSRMTWSV